MSKDEDIWEGDQDNPGEIEDIEENDDIESMMDDEYQDFSG